VLFACTDNDWNPLESKNRDPNIEYVDFIEGDSLKFQNKKEYTFSLYVRDPDRNALTVQAALDTGQGVINLDSIAPNEENIITGKYSPAKLGDHVLRFDVSDGIKKFTTTHKIHFYRNKLPKSVFTFRQLTQSAPYQYEFDASQSSDEDGRLMELRWRFEDKPITSPTLQTKENYAFEKAGNFPVTLFVTDDDNDTDSLTVYIQTDNKKPSIKLNLDKKAGSAPLTINFDASGTVDPDGSIKSYTLSFGDESDPVSALTGSYTYKVNGSYPLTFSVTDNYNLVSDTTIVINVSNSIPTAELTLSKETAGIGEFVDYDATASKDIDGSIVSYEITQGDNVYTSPKGSLRFITPGTFTIKLKVVDDKGASAQIFRFIQVVNNSPQVDFAYSLSSESVPSIITLSPNASDPDNDAISEYRWDLGESIISEETNAQVKYTFTSVGEKRIKLTVFDTHGASSSVEKVINLGNGVPSAVLKLNTTEVTNGSYISLDGSESKDLDGGDLLEYKFIILNDSGSTVLNSTSESTFQYRINDPVGTLKFGLQVLDNENEWSNTVTKNVLVNNSKPIAELDLLETTKAAPFTIVANGSKSRDLDPYDVLSHRFYLNDVLVSSTSSLTKELAEVGTYTLLYKVIDKNGSEAEVSRNINVLSNDPIASFSMSADSGKIPFTLNLNATSSRDPDPNDEIELYTWTVSDASSSVSGSEKTLHNHTFTNAGDYTVSLTVQDKFGNKNTSNKAFRALDGIAATSFELSPSSSSQTNTTLTFTASSSEAHKYNWYYSPSGTENKTLIQTITNNNKLVWKNNLPVGNVSFFLQVEDQKGNLSSFSESSFIIENTSPTSVLSLDKTSSASPLKLSISGINSSDPDIGDNLDFTWLLDGNLVSNNISDTLIIEEIGTHELKLLVRDSHGSTSTSSEEVIVYSNQPTADFSFTPQSGNAPISVTFSASNSTDPDGDDLTRYEWNFGDGGTASGASSNFVVHEFKNTGQYNVRLRVKDSHDVWSEWITKTFNASNSSPLAKLSVNPISSEIVGKPVTLSGSLSSDPNGEIVKYIFSYERAGNETILSDSEQSEVVLNELLEIGTLNFKLKVVDNDNDTSSYAIKSYQIINSNPISQFSINKTSGNVPFDVFVDASTSYDPSPNQTLSFNWYIDNQLVSTKIQDSLRINSPGEHEIVLTVIDNYNASSSANKQLNGISNAPIARFTMSDSLASIPTSIFFDASSSFDNDQNDFITNYVWSFGDGSEIIEGSNKAQVNHNYTQKGSFKVRLTVTDNFGKSNTIEKVFIALGGVEASSFTVSPQSTVNGETIVFQASKSGNYTYDWYYAYPGQSDKIQIAQVQNNNTLSWKNTLNVGSVNFYLKLTDQDEYESPFTQVTYVISNRLPNAIVNLSPSTGQSPLTVNWDASSSSDPDPNDSLSYELFLNDVRIVQGTQSAGSFTINDVGNHNVKLLVLDAHGGSKEVSKTVTVEGSTPVASFSMNSAEGQVPHEVIFNAGNSDPVDGTISNYEWSFDDGETLSGSDKKIVTHTFENEAVYDVELTVTNSHGKSHTTTSQVTALKSIPTSDFTVSPSNSASSGETLTFTAGLNFSGSYLWYFSIDGGSNKTLMNRVTNNNKMIYNGNLPVGIISFYLRLVDADQDSSAFKQLSYIIENTQPTSQLSVSPISGDIPLTITYDASTSFDTDVNDSISSTQIYLGDNLISNTTSGTHTINQTGSFVVRAVVKDTHGGQHETSKSVSVLGSNPVASFTLSPSTGNAPLTSVLNASNSSSPDGNITNYSWDLGDGTLINGADKISFGHTFENAGTYNIQLTIENEFGKRNTSTINLVVSKNIAIPSFQISPSSEARSGETITFTSSLTGNYNYHWYYSLDNGLNKIPLQTITNNKTLTLSANLPVGLISFFHRIEDSDGDFSDFSQLSYIILNNQPQADIQISPLQGENPLTISFDASQSSDSDPMDSIANYKIYIDDNLISSSATGNSTITGVGAHQLKLEVEDINGGKHSIEKTVNVTSRSPLSSFTISAITGEAPLNTTFDASASSGVDGSINNYSWNFGDGNTLSGASKAIVTNNFVLPGNYDITLTITNSHGVSSTSTQTVQVSSSKPTSVFSIDPSSTANSTANISFDARNSLSGDGEINRYLWYYIHNLNRVLFSTQEQSLYNLDQELPIGNLQIGLRVVNSLNDTSSFVFKPFSVTNAKPSAEFTLDNATGNAPLAINFDGSGSSDPSPSQTISHQWFLNQNLISNSESDNFSIIDVGTHTLRLVVTDNLGASSEKTQIINVSSTAPTASFTVNKSTGKVPATILFNASLSNDNDNNDFITNYRWNFGDGNSAQGSDKVQVSHVYENEGSYTATLTVFDNYQKSHSYSLPITITGGQSPSNFSVSPNSSSPSNSILTLTSEIEGQFEYEWFYSIASDTSKTLIQKVSNNNKLVFAQPFPVGLVNFYLRLTNPDGYISPFTQVTYVISNRLPNAIVNLSPSTGQSPLTVNWDASSSSDPDPNDSLSYELFLNDVRIVQGTQSAGSFTINDVGNHNVKLLVLDAHGGSKEVSKTVTVEGSTPVASFSMNSAEGQVPHEVIFNAGNSDPVDGTISNYEWSFDDGETLSGSDKKIVTHTFENEAVYDVELTVTNSHGKSHTTTSQVTALKSIPTSDFTVSPSNSASSGETLTFTAGLNFSGSYLWYFSIDGGSNKTLMNRVTNNNKMIYNGNLPVGIISFYLRLVDADQDSSAFKQLSYIIENTQPTSQLSVSPISGDIPLTITYDASTSFDTDVNDSISSTQIYLGDNLISNTTSGTHTINQTGSFVVRAVVKDTHGGQHETSKSVSVLGSNPVASFTLSPSTGKTPLDLVVNASPSATPQGTITNYSWNMGDGTLTNGADKVSFGHTFDNAGTYNVELTITNSFGKTSQQTQQVVVTKNIPVPNFTISPSSKANSGAPISFTSTVNGSYKYHWYYSLDNGQNKTLLQSISNSNKYTYSGKLPIGVLSFFSQIEDSDGDLSDFSQLSYIVLNNSPIAQLSVNPTTGINPLTINFNAQTSIDNDLNDSIASYKVFLDDLQISTLSSGSQVISEVGSHILKLAVTDVHGAESLTTKSITVSSRQPSANFAVSESSGEAPFEVTFDASSSNAVDGTIASYSWNFGDGSTESGSTKAIVNHTFNIAKQYTITLTVTNTHGVSNSTTQVINTLNSAPSAHLTVTPSDENYSTESIVLDGSNSTDPNGSVKRYLWSYRKNLVVTELGETSNSRFSISEELPIGSLQFALRVVDNNNDTSEVFYDNYTILNAEPISEIVLNKASGQAPLTVNFDASNSYDPSNNQSITYQWYLNDNLVSNKILDNVEIAAVGTHELRLVVTDVYNASSTSSKQITVNSNAPVSLFSKNKSNGRVPELITFNANSSSDPDQGDYIAQYSWNFGDGNTITGNDKIQVSHEYLSEGTFTVTLTVTDNFGLKHTSSQSVNIAGGILPSDFTISPESSAKSGEILNFTASTNANLTYHWYFSTDGGETKNLIQSVKNNNKFVLNNRLPVGLINFYLQLEDETTSYVSEFTQLSYLITNNEPTPKLNLSPLNGEKPLTVSFNASETTDLDPNDVLTYELFLNDVSISTNTIGTFIINEVGTHRIKLVVKDNFNASVELEKEIVVSGKKPIASFSTNPNTGFHPLPVVFDASNSSTEDGSITNYSWNFGDGFTTSGSEKSVLSHEFTKTGNYNVTLTVTNSYSKQSFISKQIIVQNSKPNAEFTVSASQVLAGTSLSLDAEASNDNNGSIQSYKWYIDGVLLKTTSSNNTTIPMNYSVGNHLVLLSVIDNEGLESDQVSEQIAVINSAPFALFDIDNTSGVSSISFNADASSSYDESPDQTISYQWFLNDNLIGSNSTLTYNLNLVGTHELKLLVKDNLNASSEKLQTLNVASTKPTANFTLSSTQANVPANITFDASSSFDNDNGDEIANYHWDFGDGTSIDEGATKKFVTHEFTAQGYYIVTLTVTDKFGLSHSIQKGFQALNGIPLADFTITPENTSKAFSTLLFDASGSVDQGKRSSILLSAKELGIKSTKVSKLLKDFEIKSDSKSSSKKGNIVRYNWFYSLNGSDLINIGTVENNPIFIWQANLPVGPLSFYLTVEDDQGATSPRQQLVYILENNAPVSNINLSPIVGENPLSVTFDGTSSSDKDLSQSLTYKWFVDGQQISTSPTQTSSISGIGSHIVRLLIEDSEGASSESSTTVTVNSRPPVAQISSNVSFGAAPLDIVFNASSSFDLDDGDAITKYSIDFGDGNTSTQSTASFTHTYTNIGDYTARLTVTDSYNKTHSVTKVISVGNSNPLPQLTISPSTGAKNSQQLTLDASGTVDPTNDNLTRFKFSLQEFNGTKVTLYEGANNSHTLTLNNNIGEARFFLEVEDENGGISTELSKSYIIGNTKPTSAFTLNNNSGVNGFAFQASNTSSDVDPNDELTYAWYLDGVFVSDSLNYSSTLNGVGSHTLRLTATDASNEFHNFEQNLTVTSSTPIASFTMSEDTAQIPHTVSFNASASSDPDAEQLSYQWNFGDGSSLVSGTDKSFVTHEYESVGVFTVTLTVSDQSNLTNSVTSEFVALNGVPTSSFTLSSANFQNDNLLTLNGASSTASGSASITLWKWYYQYSVEEPTLIATNNTATYLYNPSLNVGGAKIGLIVEDNEGNESDISFTSVLVANTNPVAAYSVNQNTGSGSYQISFDASSSTDIDPNHAANLTYSWSFDGDIISTNVADTYTVSENIGSYALILTVTDPSAGSDTESKTITVTSRAPQADIVANVVSGSAPLEVTFNATTSSDPDNGDNISNYSWNYGDGSPIESNSSYSIRTHTFNVEGTYNTVLTVTDQYGLTHSTNQIITVSNGVPTALFSQSLTSAKNNQQVFLDGTASSDVGSGSIAYYHWKTEISSVVIDLTTTTTPTYNYTTNMPVGISRLGLVVEDNEGTLSSPVFRNITITNTDPVASFVHSPASGGNPLRVYLNPSASSDIDPDDNLTFTWRLDGDIIVPVNDSITVNGVGTHTILLTASDENSGDHSVSKTVSVSNNSPTLNLASNVSSGSVPLTVNFDATGTDVDGQTLTYTWDFKDGNTSTSEDPTHIFTSVGSYLVSASVSDGETTVSKTISITVSNTNPVVVAGASATSITPSTEIDFTAGLSDPDVGQSHSFAWDFDNGDNSTDQNPAYTFDSPGTYDVSVTVNDGYATSSDEITITVSSTAPTALFTSNTTTAAEPATINFDASASNDSDPGDEIALYSWNFGDGTIPVTGSSRIFVSHEFELQGSYTVTLTVTDNYGITSNTSSVMTITNGAPTASFTQNKSSSRINEVAFLNGSASSDIGDGSIAAYHWKREVSSVVSDIATSITPTYNYTVDMPVGVNRIGLQVEDNEGALSAITWRTYTVNNTNPVANFTYTPSSGANNLNVTLDPSLSSDPDVSSSISYTWELDGNPIVPSSNVITVSGVGDHSIELTATDNVGATNSTTKTVTINNTLPVLNISSNITSGLAPLSVNFTATASDVDGQNLNYSWNFKDGNNSSNQNPSNVFNQPGTYLVEATVTDGIDNVSKTISITAQNTAPVLNIASNLNYGIGTFDIAFTATASDLNGQSLTYLWDFGDGSTSTLEDPTHQYVTAGAGSYTVSCTVSDGITTTNKTMTITSYSDDGNYEVFTKNLASEPSGWSYTSVYDRPGYVLSLYYVVSESRSYELENRNNSLVFQLAETKNQGETLPSDISNADNSLALLQQDGTFNFDDETHLWQASTVSKQNSGSNYLKQANYSMYYRSGTSGSWVQLDETEDPYSFDGVNYQSVYYFNIAMVQPSTNSVIQLRIVDEAGIERIFQYITSTSRSSSGTTIRHFQYSGTIK
jgi:PKD repeat protein